MNQLKTAKFEKVSPNQFLEAFANNYKEFSSRSAGDVLALISKLYENIELPKRGTSGSAGYDFRSPFDIYIQSGESFTFGTGIRCQMSPEYFLMIVPRSSLGFKYKLTLDNTVGIIDSDYYNSDNEGHIMIKVTNNSNRTLHINAGDKIAQGIFLPYIKTDDDDVTENRNGGIGSTGR